MEGVKNEEYNITPPSSHPHRPKIIAAPPHRRQRAVQQLRRSPPFHHRRLTPASSKNSRFAIWTWPVKRRRDKA
ncbi:hypothetical protein QL285_079753 [Trifolium repens]|nr:hypothetical protein QL285_079753 [Trifolium repens]